MDLMRIENVLILDTSGQDDRTDSTGANEANDSDQSDLRRSNNLANENIESASIVENRSSPKSPHSVIQYDTLNDDQPSPDAVLNIITSDAIDEPDSIDHSTKAESIQSSEKSPLLTCEICDQSFTSCSQLLGHKSTTHTIENNISLVVKNDDIDSVDIADIEINTIEDLDEVSNDCKTDSFNHLINKEISSLDQCAVPSEIEGKISTTSSHLLDQPDTDQDQTSLCFVDCDHQSNDAEVDMINVGNSVQNITVIFANENKSESTSESFKDCVAVESLDQCEMEVEVSSPFSDIDSGYENIHIPTVDESSSDSEVDGPQDVEEILDDIESDTINDLVNEAGCEQPVADSRTAENSRIVNGNGINSEDHDQTNIAEDKFEEISIDIDLDTTINHQTHRFDQNSTSNKSFNCKKCDKTFTSEKGLRIHEKQQSHGPGGRPNPRLKCQQCDFHARYKHNLKYHILTRHGSSVTCPTCGKLCDNRISYLNHRRNYHTNKPPSQKHTKKYTCALCQKDFWHKSTLKSHLRRHNKRFRCKQCGKTFAKERGLRVHGYLRSHKIDQSTLTLDCDKCDYHAKNRPNLNYHSATKHTGPVLCPTCGVSCSNRISFLYHHRRVHLNKKEFICAHCEKSFGDKRILLAHLRNHSSAHKCEECDERFPTKMGLRTHKRIHTSVTVIKCDVCDFTFNSRRMVNDHMLSQHGIEGSIQCNLCDELFKSQTSLSRHNTKVHKQSARIRYVRDTSEPIICNDCGISFWARTQLIQHIEFNHMVEESICQVCNKTLRSKASLKKHMRHNHNLNKYTCEICDYKCPTPSRLQDHFRTHLGENPYSCDVCDSSFTNRKSLIQHKTTHEEESQFVCDHCQEKFRLKISLREHIRETHTFPFKCNQCHKRFSTEGELCSQENAHTSDGKLVPQKKCICEICGKACATEFYLALHQRVHNDALTCSTCQESFNSIKLLSRHLLSHAPAEKIPCETCGKTFINTSALKTHQRVHQRDPNDELTCIHCQKSFDTKKDMTHHLRSHESLEGVPCETCGKTFTNTCALRTHQRVHQRDPNDELTCNHCQEAFTSKKDLTRHLRSHEALEGVACETCGKTFTSTGGLKTHQRIHQREFTCNHCHKSFNRRSNMARHLRTHEPPKKMCCETCGKTFTCRSGFKSHLRMHQRVHSDKLACDYCQRPFNKRKDLTRHLRSHDILEQMSCETCGQNFLGTAALISHQKMHQRVNNDELTMPTSNDCQTSFDLGEPSTDQLGSHVPLLKMPCEICGLTFINTATLRSHQKQHRKKFTCEICEYRFSSLSMLTDHFRTHTGETPYLCDICDLRFSTKTDLHWHNRIYHSPNQIKKAFVLPRVQSSNKTPIETIVID